MVAQSNLGKTWITGNGGLRFTFNGSNIVMSDSVLINTIFAQGSSSICDDTGELILLSNGFTLFNKYGNVIEGGDSLTANSYYIMHYGYSIDQQSSIILPMDSGLYYFINCTFTDARHQDCNLNNHCSFDRLYYSIVDVNANSGQGKVISRMQPLMIDAELSKTQMMACRHGNGKDWWLLKQSIDSNVVYKFLFTKDSVYNYGSQSFGNPKWGLWDLYGQSTFDHKGERYATTTHGLGGYERQVAMFEFDRCYGILSNCEVIVAAPIQFPPDTTKYDGITTGLCYSPNGNFLYIAMQYNIYQYDLIDKTWYIVAGMDTTYQEFARYSSMYLGPDNIIYIGNRSGFSKQMSRIDNPDIKGAGCNFCPRCLRFDSLGTNAYVYCPPNIPNYGLGAKTCWPLDSGNAVSKKDWSFYPNPTSHHVVIINAKGRLKVLYDAIGRAISSTIKDELDVSRLPQGVYYLFCDNTARKVVVE